MQVQAIREIPENCVDAFGAKYTTPTNNTRNERSADDLLDLFDGSGSTCITVALPVTRSADTSQAPCVPDDR